MSDEARAHAGFVVYDARHMRVVRREERRVRFIAPALRGGATRHLACAWAAAALLCAASASAQDAQPAPDTQADSSQAATPAAQPEPAANESPAASATQDDAANSDTSTNPDDAANEARAQISPEAAAQASDAKLQHELAKVRYEQDHPGLLAPWVLTVTGVALMLTGVIFGVNAVLSCPHDSCRSPWWPGWVVVGGATAGIAGAVWLRIEYREQAELQSRRYQIERDLERSRINAAPLPSSMNGPRAALQLRAAF